MVTRILLPVSGLPPARHHDTSPQPLPPRRQGHRRRQVHEKGHRTNDAFSVIYQPHEFAQIGFPTEVEHPFERWMVVALFAHLHKENTVAEMIDDLLPAAPMPPFDREIVLPARGDDPVRPRFPRARFD